MLEGGVYARCAALGRFAADTGVDDLMFVPLLFKATLQQKGPGLVNIKTVAGADAVAKNENNRRLGTFRVRGKQQN